MRYIQTLRYVMTMGVLAMIVPSAHAAAAAAPAEKRLDYKQEQLIKDAESYLDGVEGTATLLAEKAKEMKVGDASVQIDTVKQLLASKDAALVYLKYAENRFKQLPTDHSKVKPQFDRVEPLKASFDASTKKLTEVLQGLQTVVDKGSGEGFKADFDRLRQINTMFNAPEILEQNPERAVAVAKQIAAVKAERQQIAEKYADLLKQSTPEAKEMNSALSFFDEVFGKFEKAAKAYVAAAPGKIDASVNEAMKMGAEAVSEKKPLFFGEHGGITQRLSWAQMRYEVLAALAPESSEAPAAKKKIEEAHAQIAVMKDSLAESIVSTNEPPAEVYNGPDKATLIGLVKTKWGTSGVTAEVLKMGINSTAWQRDTRWEHNTSGWYKVDSSRIQGFVIVKTSNTMAAIYHINLVKDHMASDQITAYFFNDPKEAPGLSQKLLAAKVK